jgi:hypothetical protein
MRRISLNFQNAEQPHPDETQQLTRPETIGVDEEVKSELAVLLERVRKAAPASGKKSVLANFLGAPLASVSRWLSGEREPGGEITLKMPSGVEQQERKK